METAMMAMRRLGLLIGIAACGALYAVPGIAAPVAAPLDGSFAQSTKPRPQIRINRYPFRRYPAVYPLPYDVEYPGPGGVRQCVNRYVTERRPSGNVVVPHMRCTWVVRR
jgi:hypothetical protein